jgi:hypothetical protein
MSEAIGTGSREHDQTAKSGPLRWVTSSGARLNDSAPIGADAHLCWWRTRDRRDPDSHRVAGVALFQHLLKRETTDGSGAT